MLLNKTEKLILDLLFEYGTLTEDEVVEKLEERGYEIIEEGPSYVN